MAAELGTLLSVHSSATPTPTLRIEVRAARDVPDTPATWRFLDARNDKALIGRWVHNPSTGIVALVADLPVGESTPLAYAVEAVAEMVTTAETLAFLSAPQRDLHAGKALTLVDGRRRKSWHPVTRHLRLNVHPAGDLDRIPALVLPLVQNGLLYTLPGWYIEHDARQVHRGGG